MLTPDQIGHIAEAAADADLSYPVSSPRERVIFKPTYLGDKYPVVDFLVDILAPDSRPIGYFFAQVKGTTRTLSAARLPITVSADGFNRLVAVPAPTYLIGVDVRSRSTYLVAAHTRRGRAVSSITRGFPLGHDAVKLALYEEVAEFWEVNGRKPWRTRFRDV